MPAVTRHDRLGETLAADGVYSTLLHMASMVKSGRYAVEKISVGDHTPIGAYTLFVSLTTIEDEDGSG